MSESEPEYDELSSHDEDEPSDSSSCYPFIPTGISGIIDAQTSRRSGWKRVFRDPHEYEDVTKAGVISLSSAYPNFGVKELLDDSPEKFWKTNQLLPHKLIVEFNKKIDLCYLMIYVDHKKDESYCPSRIKIELGYSSNHIWFKKQKLLDKPQGWVKIELLELKYMVPSRVMTVVLTVEGNHEGGRDCSLRHFCLIGPAAPKFAPLNRIFTDGIGGTRGLLPTCYYHGKPSLSKVITKVYNIPR